MVGIQLTDFDLDGPLRTGEILQQNQAILLLSHKGEIRENPALGIGISDMLLDNDPQYWRAVIRENLALDGEKVNSVKILSTGIEIDANY